MRRMALQNKGNTGWRCALRTIRRPAIAANPGFWPTLANPFDDAHWFLPRRTVNVAATASTAHGCRRRRTAASSSRSARGRNAPPGCRAAGRRCCRSPGRSPSAAGLRGTGSRSSIASVSAFLYRSGSPGAPNRFRCQRVAPVATPILSGQVVALHRQQTVVPKLVVVVEVLVHEAERPLGDQLPHRVLDALLAPVVSASRRVRPGARPSSRSSGTPPDPPRRPLWA